MFIFDICSNAFGYLDVCISNICMYIQYIHRIEYIRYSNIEYLISVSVPKSIMIQDLFTMCLCIYHMRAYGQNMTSFSLDSSCVHRFICTYMCTYSCILVWRHLQRHLFIHFPNHNIRAGSDHATGYVRHLSAQFLMSQLIRGLPMALAVTSVQYLLLKAGTNSVCCRQGDTAWVS